MHERSSLPCHSIRERHEKKFFQHLNLAVKYTFSLFCDKNTIFKKKQKNYFGPNLQKEFCGRECESRFLSIF
jgi:hypothetical protein